MRRIDNKNFPNLWNIGIPQGIKLDLTKKPKSELDKVLGVTGKPVTSKSPRMFQTDRQKRANSIANYYNRKSTDEQLGINQDVYYEDDLDRQISNSLDYYNKVDETGMTQYQKDLEKEKQDKENKRKTAFADWGLSKILGSKGNPFKFTQDVFSDVLGFGVQRSVDADLSSTLGQQQAGDLRVKLAESHKQYEQLQDQIQQDKNNRDKLQFIINNYNNPRRLQELGFTITQSKQQYEKQLQDLDNKLYNNIKKSEQLKDLDDSYKIMYTQDRMYPNGGYGLDILGQAVRTANEFGHIASFKDYLLTTLATASNVAGKIANVFGNNIIGKTFSATGEKLLDDRDTNKRDIRKELNDYYLNEYNKYVNENAQEKYKTARQFDDEATNDYINANKELSKDQNGEYERLMKARQSYDNFFNVSPEYQKLTQANEDNANLLDPMYYLAVLPGTIGSSSSSVPGMIASGINLASTALGSYGIIASQILTTPLQAMSGQEESYGISGDLRVQQLKDAIADSSITGPKGSEDIYQFLSQKAINNAKNNYGWSDKYAKKYFNPKTDEGTNNILRELAAGNIKYNNPNLNKALLSSLKGTETVRDLSNVRTGHMLPISIAMQIYPFAKMTGKFGMNKLGLKLSGSATNPATKAYIQAFKKGASVGSELGSAGGIVGKAAGAAAGGIAGAAAKAGKKIFTNRASTILKQYSNAVGNKVNKVLNKYLPIDSKRALLAKYGLTHAKVQLFNAVDEGIEEGSQQIFQNSNLAEMYGYNTAPTLSILSRDVEAGLRTGQFMVDQLFGTNYSGMRDDQEMLSNVVGGFAAGLFNSNAIIQGYGVYKDAKNSKQALDAIREDVSMIDESYGDVRDSYFSIAKQAMSGRTQNMRDVLNLARKRGLVGDQDDNMFTEQQFNGAEQAVRDIDNLVQNYRYKSILESKGIKYGTDEYATAIADIYDNTLKLQENIEQDKQNNADLHNYYNSEDFQNQVEKIVNRYTDLHTSPIAPEIQERIQEARAKAESETKEQLKQNKELSDSEKNRIIQDAMDKAEATEMENIRKNTHDNVVAKSQLFHKIVSTYGLYKSINSVRNFGKMVKEKFGINIKRPDTDLILRQLSNDIKHYIAQYKEFLPEDAVIPTNFEDALRFLQNDPTMMGGIDDKNVALYWARNAILRADSAVLNRYLRRVEYGVVQNSDKSYSYNPEEYERRKSERKAKNEALRKGKEYTPSTSEITETSKKSSEDPYVRRVNSIMENRRDFNKVNSMVADIYDGDLTANEELNSPEIEEDEVVQPYDSNLNDNTEERLNEERINKKREENRRKYAHLKWEARDKYRKRLRERFRKRMSRMNADLTLGLGDVIKDAFDSFIVLAKTGKYTIDNIVDDILSDIDINENDTNYDLAVNLIKANYRRYKAHAPKEEKENLSTNEEIKKFGNTNVGDVSHEPDNAQKLTTTQIFDNLRNNIRVQTFPVVITKDDKGWHYYVNMTFIDNEESFNKYVEYFIHGKPEEDRSRYDEFIDYVRNIKNSDDAKNYDSFVKNYEKNITKHLIKLLNEIDNSIKDRINIDSNSAISENVLRFLYDDVTNINPKSEEYNIIREALSKYLLDLGISISNAPRFYSIENGDRTKNELLDHIKLLLQNPNYIGTSDTDKKQTQDAKNLIELFNQLGERIIAYNLPVYGTVDGKNILSLADLITIDNNDNVRVYDVTTTISNPETTPDLLTTRKYRSTSKWSKLKQLQSNLSPIINVLINENVNLKTPAGIFIWTPNSDSSRYVKVYEGVKLIQPVEIIDINTNSPIQFVDTPQISDEDINNLKNEYSILLDNYTALYDQIIELMNTVTKSLNKEGNNINNISLKHPKELELTDIDNIKDNKLIWEYISERAKTISQELNNIEEFKKQLNSQIPDKSAFAINYQNKLNELRTKSVVNQDNEQFFNNLYTNIFPNLADLQQKIPTVYPVTNATERQIIKNYINNIIAANMTLNAIIENNPNVDVSEQFKEILNYVNYLKDVKNFNGSPDSKSLYFRNWFYTDMTKIDNEVDPANAYIQKIKAFTNLVNNLIESGYAANQENKNVVQWYHIVVNKYFKQLINNFKNYLKNTNIPENNVTTRNAEDAIKRFNSVTDVTVLPENPTIDQINDIDISWKHNYNTTDLHQPSFIDMNRNRDYGIISIKPDFISNSEFELIKNSDGNIVLHIVYKKDTKDEVETSLGFITPIRDDYDEKSKNRAYIENQANQKFLVKVNYMLDYIKNNKDCKIAFNVYPNRGKLTYDKNNKYNIADKLFSNDLNKHDVNTITISQKDRIGYLRPIGDRNGTSLQVVSESRVIYNPKNDGLDQKMYDGYNGKLAYLYRLSNDKNSSNNQIMTILQIQSIGEEDANKLYTLISYYINGYDKISVTINSKQVSLDILSLLKQRLFIGDIKENTSSHSESKIYISRDRHSVKIGNTEYNIVSDSEKLKNALKNRLNTSNDEQLNAKMSLVFSDVIGEIQHVDKIELPNGLTLTPQDFGDNYTYFGYLIKHNYIYTNVSGISPRYINISNPILVNKSIQNIANQNKEKDKKDDFFDFGVNINKTGNKRPTNLLNQIFGKRNKAADDNKGALKMIDKPVNRSKDKMYDFMNDVMDYMHQVFGDTVDVEFKEADAECFKPASKNRCTVGVCSADMITISKAAPKSVKYHEAFHRVMELLLPDNVRELFYAMYRKRNGKNLTDREVAEGLADMYTSYGQNIIDWKKSKFWKKLITFYKPLKFACIFARRAGLSRMRKFLNLYHEINNGTFKDRLVSDEKQERFVRLFGDGLRMEVKNPDTGDTAQFSNISNDAELRDLVKGISCIIITKYNQDTKGTNLSGLVINGETPNILGQEYIDILTGKDIPEEQLTNTNRVLRELFEYEEITVNESKYGLGKIVGYLQGRDIKRGFQLVKYNLEQMFGENIPYYLKGKTIKYYPKFAALTKQIADYIQSIYAAYTEENDLSDPMDEDEEVASNNMDKFDKQSYEFPRLNSVSTYIRQIFATVPYLKFNEETRDIIEPDLSKNIYGLPMFMPISQVYQILLNDLYDIESAEDLYYRLKNRALTNPVYAYIFNKFSEEYNNRYVQTDTYTWGKDESGNKTLVKSGTRTVINYDSEAFVEQMFNAISSQKMNFILAKFDTSDGNKNIRIIDTTYDRDIVNYPKLWYQNLMSGRTGVFSRTINNGLHYLTKDNIDVNGKGVNIFHSINNMFSLIRNKLNSIEALSPKQTDECLQLISKLLNKIGIQVNPEVITFMLESKYGNVSVESLRNWICTVEGSNNIDVLIRYLSDIVDLNGYENINNKNSRGNKKTYANIGFVTDLAYWFGQYKKSVTDNSIIGLDGKTLNTMSQNDSMSQMVKFINKGDINDDTILLLSNFKYVYEQDVDMKPIGSMIMKRLMSQDPNGNNKLRLQIHTQIGSKTNSKNIPSSSYKEQTEVDDYMSRYALARRGYIMFPTLADKSRYYVISGISTPGMSISVEHDYKNDSQKTVVKNAPSVIFIGSGSDTKAYLIPCNEVLDQMIEYARTERDAIESCINDLKNMPEESKVDNYHTGKYPNGTRFISLSQLLVPAKDKNTGEIIRDSHGNIAKLEHIQLNNYNEDSQTLLNRADEEFFNKSIDEQRLIMGLTLNLATASELKYAENLGIIYKRDIEKNTNGESTIVFSKDSDNNLNYNSLALNNDEIYAITWYYMNVYGFNDSMHEQTMRSLAIAAMIQDMCVRNIISTEEMYRMFIGHPGFFKVKYNKTTGEMIDNSTDLSKRIGSAISTGEDNDTNMYGIDDYYTCAELQDYEVVTQSLIKDDIKDMFVEGFIRDLYYSKVKDDEKSEAFTKGFNEIEKYLSKHYSNELDRVIKIAEDSAYTYNKAMNIADGATFITDKMLEKLLRMRGAYTQEVAEVFDVLRDKNTRYDWVKDASLVRKIFNITQLVNYKYSAYGFRTHSTNDKVSSNVAVPYVNKTSLAPLFPSMCYGKMKDIYNQMLEEGVDLLSMKSSVKFGGQGAISFDGNKLSGPFVKYKQRFEFLRRQLNTDPEKEDRRAVGTQCIKVLLQNLRLYKKYKSVGELENENGFVTGEKLLSQMMDAIDKLSDDGISKLNEKFFNDRGEIDNEKLSNYLMSQLTSRDANKNLINAISPKVENGKTELNCPLAATSNSKWIESILISTINKDIIDIDLPGASYVQRTVFAMHGEGGTILSDADMAPTINGGKKLQMYNPDGSMDAVISISYFKDIIPDGISGEAARQWLIDNNIIGDNAKANTVGYRIPTQGESSIHALRFVDVIFTLQDTIILPEEFVGITGSDFDIDHLYLFRYNYKINYSGVTNPVMFVDRDDEGSKKYQNIIVDVALSLLQDKDTFHIIYRSIDNDTELPRSHVNRSESTVSEANIPYSYGMPHLQTRKKKDFNGGKFGIGPFALNITNQNLTAATGVTFKHTLLGDSCGILSLSNIMDSDGNYIQSYLSGSLNGEVDIVKDPWISSLNINSYTYNMLCMLIRTGHGHYGYELIKQPVIVAMAETAESTKSQFFTDDSSIVKYSVSVKNKIRETVKQYTGLSDKDLDDIEIAINNNTLFPQKQGSNVYYSCINSVKNTQKNIEMLKAASKYKQPIKQFKYNGSTYDMQHLQAEVYRAWCALKPFADALSRLVQSTKIDTKKHGKTALEQIVYKYNYDKLFGDIDYYKSLKKLGDKRAARFEAKSLFNLDSLYDLIHKTWIDKKTNTAIGSFSDIMQNQIFTANKIFSNFVIEMCNDVVTLDNIQQISNAAITAIKLQYINNYAKLRGVDIKYLFVKDPSGKHITMQERLNNLTYLIDNYEKYSYLKNNVLLQNLIPADVKDPVFINDGMYQLPEFITVFKSINESSTLQDDFTEGWNQLLQDKDVQVQNFAKDLIIYAFVSSGEYGGWNHIAKYVPVEWILGQYDNDLDIQSFSDYIYDLLHNDALLQGRLIGLAEDIYSNNFTNRTLIKHVSKSKLVKEANAKLIYLQNQPEYPLVIVIPSDDESFILKSNAKSTIYQNYINLKDNRFSNVENINNHLYKLVYQNNNVVIYVAIPPKGYHEYGGFDIYEYGDNYGFEFNKSIYPKNTNIQSVLFNLNSVLEQIEKIGKSVTYQSFDPQFEVWWRQSILLPIINSDGNTRFDYDPTTGTLNSANYDNGAILLRLLDSQGEDDNENELQLPSLDDILNSNEDVPEQYQFKNIHQIGSEEKYDRADVEKDTDNLYIFTDNTDRTSGRKYLVDVNSNYYKTYGINSETGEHRKLYYPTVTQAVIRGLNNAFPISTQKWYHTGAIGAKGNWVESDAEEFYNTLKSEIYDILYNFENGDYKDIIISSIFNNPISDISKSRTPNLQKILYNVIKFLDDYVGYIKENRVKTSSDNSNLETQRKIKDQTLEAIGGKNDQKQEDKYVTLSNDHIGDISIFGEMSPYYAARTDINFNSVEQAFQFYKLATLWSWYLDDSSVTEMSEEEQNKIFEITSPIQNAIDEILNTDDIEKIKSIGNRNFNVDKRAIDYWNKRSSIVKDELIKISKKSTNVTQQSDNQTINVYAGTGDNVQFSNFAERRLLFNGTSYRTPEGAYQAQKLNYSVGLNDTQKDQLRKKFASSTGAEARALGRIINIIIKQWDDKSNKILGDVMLQSFIQNPTEMIRLINTGNSIITHKDESGKEQDNGRFSMLLTNIRNVIRDSIDSFAERWSVREGWSKDYFYNNILPNIYDQYMILYKLSDDQTTPTNNRAQSKFIYNNNGRNDLTSKTTLEAIRNGERTSTTRSKNIDFWKGFNPGDRLMFKDDSGNSVYVDITNKLFNLGLELHKYISNSWKNNDVQAMQMTQAELKEAENAIRDVYKKSINIDNDKQQFIDPFDGYRQIKLKIPGTDIYVHRAIEIIKMLRNAESVGGDIDSTINAGDIINDWVETKSVANLFKDKDFAFDVESILESYENKNPEQNGTDFSELSKNIKFSEIITNIILQSGAYIKEDPNQLSFDFEGGIDSIQISDEELKEAEQIRKKCKGE